MEGLCDKICAGPIQYIGLKIHCVLVLICRFDVIEAGEVLSEIFKKKPVIWRSFGHLDIIC